MAYWYCYRDLQIGVSDPYLGTSRGTPFGDP
jgi:hypothetical protein